MGNNAKRVELKVDRSTLPVDYQAIRFHVLDREQEYEGIFLEGDDLFWHSQRLYFQSWGVDWWEPIPHKTDLLPDAGDILSSEDSKELVTKLRNLFPAVAEYIDKVSKIDPKFPVNYLTGKGTGLIDPEFTAMEWITFLDARRRENPSISVEIPNPSLPSINIEDVKASYPNLFRVSKELGDAYLIELIVKGMHDFPSLTIPYLLDILNDSITPEMPSEEVNDILNGKTSLVNSVSSIMVSDHELKGMEYPSMILEFDESKMQDRYPNLRKRLPLRLSKESSSEMFRDKDGKPFIMGNPDVPFALDGCTILEMEELVELVNSVLYHIPNSDDYDHQVANSQDDYKS